MPSMPRAHSSESLLAQVPQDERHEIECLDFGDVSDSLEVSWREGNSSAHAGRWVGTAAERASDDGGPLQQCRL